MVRRCTTPTHQAFRNYGARGITVCERWHKFEHFYADMGDKPIGLDLDRIDNEKGYSPDNCRWATRKQNIRNTRKTLKITIGGITRSATEWAEMFGFERHIIRNRYAKGVRGENLLRELCSGRELIRSVDDVIAKLQEA